MSSTPSTQAPAPGASTMDRYLLFPLLCAYVAVVQFGSLMRVSDIDKSYGLSTAIIVFVVLLGIRRVLWASIAEPLFWVVGALIVYMIVPSVLSEVPLGALVALFQLGCYVCLAALLARTRLSTRQVFVLWIWIGCGLFLSAALTIVDFAGILDIPRNNNLWISTKVGVEQVEQASGFFPRRSAMAAIFSLSIAGSLVFALGHSSLIVRLGFLAAACTGLLCVFLTHNRSGVFGSLAVIGIYVLVAPRFRGLRRIGMLTASIVIGLCMLLVIVRYYPEHASIYIEKLGFLGLAEETWESDHLRIDLFRAAVRAIGSNPLGNGLTLVRLPGGASMNAHNVVTAVIWGAGAFAMIWLPIFAATLYGYFAARPSMRRGTRAPITIEHEAIICALASWFANGMTHNILQTGLAWMLLGILVANRHFNAQPSGRPTTRPAVGGSDFGAASEFGSASRG